MLTSESKMLRSTSAVISPELTWGSRQSGWESVAKVSVSPAGSAATAQPLTTSTSAVSTAASRSARRGKIISLSGLVEADRGGRAQIDRLAHERPLLGHRLRCAHHDHAVVVLVEYLGSRPHALPRADTPVFAGVDTHEPHPRLPA